MQTRHWNKRRLIVLFCATLAFYVVFSASYNTYESDVTIKNTKPEIVWEYVADFQKMKLLNPTILDFKITKESGHLHNWQYSVEYLEKLSHWPFWKNIAEADYEVRKLDASERGEYAVTSSHRTCFAAGLYCLYSKGEFLFSAIGPDTYCLERVHYQCPPFFGSVCRREVEFQRKAIMRNLTLHFEKKFK